MLQVCSWNKLSWTFFICIVYFRSRCNYSPVVSCVSGHFPAGWQAPSADWSLGAPGVSLIVSLLFCRTSCHRGCLLTAWDVRVASQSAGFQNRQCSSFKQQCLWVHPIRGHLDASEWYELLMGTNNSLISSRQHQTIRTHRRWRISRVVFDVMTATSVSPKRLFFRRVITLPPKANAFNHAATAASIKGVLTPRSMFTQLS